MDSHRIESLKGKVKKDDVVAEEAVECVVDVAVRVPVQEYASLLQSTEQLTSERLSGARDLLIHRLIIIPSQLWDLYTMNLREFSQLAFVSRPVHENVGALPDEVFESEMGDSDSGQVSTVLRDEVSGRNNHPA
jgi:hypothetical protein